MSQTPLNRSFCQQCPYKNWASRSLRKMNRKDPILVFPITKLREYQEKFNEFDKVLYPGNDTMKMALGVAEEVGELCHHVLKRAQGLGDQKEHLEEIKDALADIAVFSMQLASFEGIDWEENFFRVADEVLKRTREKVEKKYATKS